MKVLSSRIRDFLSASTCEQYWYAVCLHTFGGANVHITVTNVHFHISGKMCTCTFEDKCNFRNNFIPLFYVQLYLD